MAYEAPKFQKFEGGNLVVPFTAWRKIQALTKAVNTEFFAYLLRNVDDYLENDDPFVVDDVFVPTQEASAAFVDMNFVDFNTLNEYCAEHGMFTIGNIHSHVDMGVTPSHTDLNDNIAKHLTQPGMVWHENGYVVTLIINKRGDCSARIDVLVDTKGKYKWLKKPTAAFEMDVLIERPEDPVEIKEWVDDAKTKLRKKEYNTGTAWDSYDERRSKRERYNKTKLMPGLVGVHYGLENGEKLERAGMASRHWTVIRRLLVEGYTLGLDTRPISDYVGLIVTREIGNQERGFTIPQPLVGKALKKRTKLVSGYKKSILKHITKGDALYIGMEDDGILRYWEKESRRVWHEDVARLCFQYDKPYPSSRLPGEERAVLWTEHKQTYDTELEKVIEQFCSPDTRASDDDEIYYCGG